MREPCHLIPAEGIQPRQPIDSLRHLAVILESGRVASGTEGCCPIGPAIIQSRLLRPRQYEYWIQRHAVPPCSLWVISGHMPALTASHPKADIDPLQTHLSPEKRWSLQRVSHDYFGCGD